MRYTEVDQRVRGFLLEQVIQTGGLPGTADIAQSLGWSEPDTERALERLEALHLLVLEPGTHRIQMMAPVSAAPTPHTVNDGETTWFANCAWDALAILPMLGRDGEISSSCADCGETIELEVRDGQTAGDTVMHLLVPARQWWADIRYT